MSLLEDIRERYEGRRTEIPVPEWGGTEEDPLILYAKPFTLIDQQSIKRWIDKGQDEGFAGLCVRKLENEDGTPHFEKGDRPALMRIADAHILQRIGAAIINSSPTVEEASGNSPTTPV